MQLLQQHFDDCGPIYLAYSGNPWACASAVLSAHDFLERPDSIRTTHNMTYPVRLDSLTGFFACLFQSGSYIRNFITSARAGKLSSSHPYKASPVGAQLSGVGGGRRLGRSGTNHLPDVRCVRMPCRHAVATVISQLSLH